MTDLAPTLRTCNKCDTPRDILSFQENSSYKSGRDNTCRVCRRSERRGRYRRNSAKPPPAQKTCTVCKKTKPGSDFPKNHGADGRQPYCRDCKGLQAKLRMYRISREDFLSRLEAQGGGCALCGTVLPSLAQFHVDHDHKCCPHGSSCGQCIRGLLCGTCNVLALPGYEQMPSHLRRCPVLNGYLEANRG